MNIEPKDQAQYDIDIAKGVVQGVLVYMDQYYVSESGVFKVLKVYYRDAHVDTWGRRTPGRLMFEARRLMKKNGELVRRSKRVITFEVLQVSKVYDQHSVYEMFEAELKAAEEKRDFLLSSLN